MSVRTSEEFCLLFHPETWQWSAGHKKIRNGFSSMTPKFDDADAVKAHIDEHIDELRAAVDELLKEE